jgi:hypothetical protein
VYSWRRCAVGDVACRALTLVAGEARATPPARSSRSRPLGRWLTECHEDTLYYTYDVRGVHYTASQDISGLRDQLPDAPERLGGMVNMKYAAQNPANSILVCEEWSGLRAAPRPAGERPPSANGNAVGHEAQDSTLAQSS